MAFIDLVRIPTIPKAHQYAALTDIKTRIINALKNKSESHSIFIYKNLLKVSFTFIAPESKFFKIPNVKEIHSDLFLLDLAEWFRGGAPADFIVKILDTVRSQAEAQEFRIFKLTDSAFWLYSPKLIVYIFDETNLVEDKHENGNQ